MLILKSEKVIIPKPRFKKAIKFAFVDLSSQEEVDKVVGTMNEKPLEERPITVKPAHPKESQEKQRKPKSARQRRTSASASGAEKSDAAETASKPKSSKKKKASKKATEASESNADSEDSESAKGDNSTKTAKSKKKAKGPKARPQRIPDDISHLDSVHVRNLAPRISNDELKEHFAELSPVWAISTFKRVRSQKDNRLLFLRYGFVKFKDTETQQKAIKQFNDTNLKNRKIHVTAVHERTDKTGTASAEDASAAANTEDATKEPKEESKEESKEEPKATTTSETKA